MNKNDVYVSHVLHKGKAGWFHSGKWCIVPFKYYPGYVQDESSFPSFYFKRNAEKFLKHMDAAAKWGLQEGWRVF